MNESKANRISKLEEHETKSDQKIYCGCRCHWKSIEDFMEIPDEKLIELAEIFERLDPSYAEDLRKEDRPKCTCKCIH